MDLTRGTFYSQPYHYKLMEPFVIDYEAGFERATTVHQDLVDLEEEAAAKEKKEEEKE